jgi:hypothetical protein
MCEYLKVIFFFNLIISLYVSFGNYLELTSRNLNAIAMLTVISDSKLEFRVKVVRKTTIY